MPEPLTALSLPRRRSSNPLLEELGPGVEIPDRPRAWRRARSARRPGAQNIWLHARTVPIGVDPRMAPAPCKARQRNWGLWPLAHFRRAR